MTPYELSDDRARLWYDPTHVDRWYHGVFEGGGARAVAYPGALEAMVESRAWFKSVTGSSAGAITAAFVGSGAHASRAAAFTVEMFNLVGVSRADGLMRLLKRGGYFPGDRLRDWLDEQFAAELARVTRRSFDRPVTFATMFEISGIETFVVATNLSLNQQIVFSHRLTPRCGVAEAVVASSSTPLAFESRLLAVPPASGDGPPKHHTIVDGGLWSNFPTYVLTDAGFRRHHGLEPQEIKESELLAFRLSQEPREEIRASPAIDFRGNSTRLDAYEWSASRRARRDTACGRWFARLLAPFALTARLLDRTDRRFRGRWPPPPRQWSKRALDAVDGIFGALTPLPVAAVVWCLTAGAAAAGVFSLLTELAAEGYSTWTWIAVLVVAVLLVLPLLALLLIGLLVNAILLKPARGVLYGLLTTYIAFGRSRVWEADRSYVVTLEVPPDITPVGFRSAVEQHEAVIADARRTTLAHLGRALRSTA
jgi:predicted acylesterase/phospholipase RssA